MRHQKRLRPPPIARIPNRRMNTDPGAQQTGTRPPQRHQIRRQIDHLPKSNQIRPRRQMQPTLPVKRQRFRRRQLPRRIIPPHPTRPAQPGHPLQRQVNAIRLHLLRRAQQTLHQRRQPPDRLLNQAAQSRPLQNPPSQRSTLPAMSDSGISPQSTGGGFSKNPPPIKSRPPPPRPTPNRA